MGHHRRSKLVAEWQTYYRPRLLPEELPDEVLAAVKSIKSHVK
jgi:hypothetical protein